MIAEKEIRALMAVISDAMAEERISIIRLERATANERVAAERERCARITEAETDASGHLIGCICWNCAKTTAIAAKIREGQS